MKKINFIVFAAYLSLSKAWACNCIQLTIAEHVSSSNNIYYGQLTSARYIDGKTYREPPFVEGELTITETLKGKARHEISVRTGLGGGDCGIQLVVGKYYAIFIDKEGGYIGSCGATRRVDFHDENEFLNKIRDAL